MSTAVEPLLERAGELAAVEALLAGARAGQGGALLLEAPAGFGKSALAARAAAAAGDFLVLRASGHELERGLGWGVARSLFEPWLLARPDAGLLDGPAASARALFEPAAAEGERASEVGFGILHGLYRLATRAAEREPLLVVVDDAHWADEPSLRFLHYLLGRLGAHPIAVLAATRSGEPGEGGLAGQLAAATAVRELAPLGQVAVTELVRRRFPRADDRCCVRCFELTRGNPLHVRELLAAIAQDGGADLRAAADRAARSLSRSVRQRLAQLPAGAQALARALAVLDGEVPLHLAAALADLEPAAALAATDELARADMIGAGDPCGFAHPLLRSAVYGALSQTDRGRLHRQAARLLAEQGASSERVGAHLLEASATGDAAVIAGLRAAAADALAHGVPEAAASYLERALREPPADEARPELLAALGRAELEAGRREAAAHLEAAIALTGEPRRRAELGLDLGRTLHDFGRVAEACDAFERAAAEAGDDLIDDIQAWYLTSAMIEPGRVADARARIDSILARAGGGDTPAERTLLSKVLIMRVYAGGERSELVPLARRIFAGGRLIDEGGLGSQAAGHVAGALSYCDEYATAEDVLARALAEARRAGLVVWVAAALQLRARQRLWTGPLPDAVEDARGAYEIFAGGRHMYLPATVYCLARGLVEQDEAGEAETVLGTLDGGERGGFAAWAAEARGRLAAHRGDHEVALAEFLAAGDLVRGLELTNPAMFHWRSLAALAALRLDQRALAAELAAEELALAERFGAPRAIGVARRATGLLERGEQAVETLRTAADLHERCGARLEQALSLVELGAAVRRAGRPTEARTAIREGMRLAAALGATALERRARDELDLAGARRDGSGELTPSERRVAELAAAGHTNREIAAELFVTVKAVEWHLGNVYRKLDIRGRRDIEHAL